MHFLKKKNDKFHLLLLLSISMANEGQYFSSREIFVAYTAVHTVRSVSVCFQDSLEFAHQRGKVVGEWKFWFPSSAEILGFFFFFF